MRPLPLLALLVLPLLAGASAAPWPGDDFEVELRPEEVRLGEPFTLEVVIRHDAGSLVGLPRRLRRLGGADVRRIERSAEEGRTTLRLELQTTEALGEVPLGELPLAAVIGGEARVASLPLPPIRVAPSVPEGDESFAELAPPREARVPTFVPLYVAAGALLGLLAGWLGWRALRARRAVAAAPEPEASPEDRALAALDALEAEGLVGAGRAKEHYFRLSAIVRRFVGEAEGVPAVDLTTSELCELLERRPSTRIDPARLRRWLEGGDLVRFAKVPDEPASAAADLEEARALVRDAARITQEAA